MPLTKEQLGYNAIVWIHSSTSQCGDETLVMRAEVKIFGHSAEKNLGGDGPYYVGAVEALKDMLRLR